MAYGLAKSIKNYRINILTKNDFSDKEIAKKIGKKSGKAAKIFSILSEFKDLSKSEILDIGSGTGVISNFLTKYSKKVYGIDIIDYRIIKKGYIFKKTNNEILPFKDNFFDVVISNQVIEHVNNQDKHLSEIFRVLEDDGVCYLATPNKYWPIEPHYHLPFLGILPRRLANLYLKIFRNEDYDINLLSYNKFIKKAKKYFIIINITKKIIINPKKYKLENKYKIIPNHIIKIISKSLLNYIVPSFIFILKKK